MEQHAFQQPFISFNAQLMAKTLNFATEIQLMYYLKLDQSTKQIIYV